MSILSRWLHRDPGQGPWYVKVDLIAELSEISRRNWCEEWVRALAAPDSTPQARLPELAGAASLRGLQVFLTTRFIARQKYLPPQDRAGFAEFLHRGLLGSVVCANDVPVHDPAAGDDTIDTFRRFAEDMARRLAAAGIRTRNAAVVIEATLPQFSLEQDYITSLAFGDEATSRRLKAQIEAADI